jgi:hypothetical protein
MMRIDRTTALCLTALLLLLNGFGNAAAGDLSMDDAKIVGAYSLTLDKMHRKYAVAADLGRQSVNDPALQGQLQSANAGNGLDAQIKAFGAVPKAAAALQAHGISARDYCLTTLAIGYALMPRMPPQYRQANSPADPDDLAAPPDHVEFVRAHRDEIRKLTEAVVQARGEASH